MGRTQRAPAGMAPRAGDRSIGVGIRDERLRRGMTLADLADLASLTPSALSQIERGVSDPSISSLRRIASALDVPMFRFLMSTDERDVVVRRGARIALTFPGRTLDYELVSATLQGRFEVLSMTLQPGAASQPAATGHAAEECTVVLSGRLDVEVGRERYVLEPGDSVSILPDVPHRFVNTGDEPSEALIVISPPAF